MNLISLSHTSKTVESKFRERAKEMIKTYIEWEKKSPNIVVGQEVDFVLEIDGVRFTGRIDRIEKTPQGEFEIVDFKSGAVHKTRNTIKTDPQMNIYALAIQSMPEYGKLPVKASLFYLEHRSVVYEISKAQVEEAIKPIKDMIRSILEERFDPTPSYKACFFCDYQSICDAKVTEE